MIMIYQECLTLINVPFSYYFLWNVLCMCTCMCAHICADTCLWGVHTYVCLCRKKSEYNLRSHVSEVRCHLCFCVYVHVCECRHMHESHWRTSGICLHLPPCLRHDPSLLLLIVAFSMLNVSICHFPLFTFYLLIAVLEKQMWTTASSCIWVLGFWIQIITLL